MPKRKCSNPEYLAAWVPKLVHPAAGRSNERHKRNPGITRGQLAVVDQVRNRFYAAVATGGFLAKSAEEIGQLQHWPLLPLWQPGLGLVELRPYPDLAVFAAVGRSELAALVNGLRVDRKKISQGQAVQALFAARLLAVWGYGLDRYFYRFPVIVTTDDRVEKFLLLRFPRLRRGIGG